MDKELDAKQLEEKIYDLAASMKGAEVVSSNNRGEMSYRKRSNGNRLERLANDIRDVFEGLPIRNGLFEFSLTGGHEQRFLIDSYAYVITNPKTKDYEFKKETRLGTSILGRTANRRHMAKLVTRYASERLLDEQRMLENEFISMKLSHENLENENSGQQNEVLFVDDDFEYGNEDLLKEKEQAEQVEPEIIERVIKTNRTSFFAILTWFCLGILATVASVVAATFYGKLDLLINWLEQLVELISKNL